MGVATTGNALVLIPMTKISQSKIEAIVLVLVYTPEG